MLDLVLGFILLSVWLNFMNGSLQIWFDNLTDQRRLALASFVVISIPAIFNIAFDYSSKSSATFFASIISVGIALVLREGFARWEEKYDIKGEIFSELYGNYRSIKEFVRTSELLQDMSPQAMGSDLNKSLQQTWMDQSFRRYFGKLQARKIYAPDVFDELEDVYKKMNAATTQIDNDDTTFFDSGFVNGISLKDDGWGVLSQIRNLLLCLDEKRSSQIFEVAMNKEYKTF